MLAWRFMLDSENWLKSIVILPFENLSRDPSHASPARRISSVPPFRARAGDNI
jgi:hypothetical protein